MCGLSYLCSECSIELSKFELQLNREFPIGKLYCSFCQSKKEREIIKKLIESEGETLDFYDYKKHKETLYDQKEKDYIYKGRSIGFMFSNNKKGSNEDN